MASPTRPDSSLQDATPAKQALESHEQALPWTWLEDKRHDDGDSFDRFCRLTREEKDRLMAWAVASTIKPQTDGSAPRTREYELAGAAAAVDIRRYWTPTATNYWGRTTKAHMVAVLGELTGGHGDHYAPMRKDALVATLERLFNNGDSAVSDAAKAAATRSYRPAWRSRQPPKHHRSVSSRLRRATRQPPAPTDLRIAITRVRPDPAVPSSFRSQIQKNRITDVLLLLRHRLHAPQLLLTWTAALMVVQEQARPGAVTSHRRIAVDT